MHPGRLNISSDGGMSEVEGSFACVLANSVHPKWIGAGPADMDPTTASSSRPELIGYAAIWEKLLLLTTLYPQ